MDVDEVYDAVAPGGVDLAPGLDHPDVPVRRAPALRMTRLHRERFPPAEPPVRLAAIADANVALGADAARRYGYEQALPSWEAVAEDPTIDARSPA
ncbi:hypothetical protein [Streptomyces sclerotialus]|uniref:hypothetical protein n=1 Tax=Streptomyces sclerotialus TaxID=1957 RepID=UPI0004C7AB2F